MRVFLPSKYSVVCACVCTCMYVCVCVYMFVCVNGDVCVYVKEYENNCVGMFVTFSFPPIFPSYYFLPFYFLSIILSITFSPSHSLLYLLQLLIFLSFFSYFLFFLRLFLFCILRVELDPHSLSSSTVPTPEEASALLDSLGLLLAAPLMKVL